MSAFSKIRYFFIFVLFLGHTFSAFAEVRNRRIISYFVDNIVFQTLYAGGYYTFGVILVLAVLSYFSRKFRQVFLSILFAIFGVFLLIFVYEAFEDFEFIPPIYS
ncbi:MAG: hypothetical protein AAF673_05225 [Pseudomonadota bacterium]